MGIGKSTPAKTSEASEPASFTQTKQWMCEDETCDSGSVATFFDSSLDQEVTKININSSREEPHLNVRSPTILTTCDIPSKDEKRKFVQGKDVNVAYKYHGGTQYDLHPLKLTYDVDSKKNVANESSVCLRSINKSREDNQLKKTQDNYDGKNGSGISQNECQNYRDSVKIAKYDTLVTFVKETQPECILNSSKLYSESFSHLESEKCVLPPNNINWRMNSMVKTRLHECDNSGNGRNKNISSLCNVNEIQDETTNIFVSEHCDILNPGNNFHEENKISFEKPEERNKSKKKDMSIERRDNHNELIIPSFTSEVKFKKLLVCLEKIDQTSFLKNNVHMQDNCLRSVKEKSSECIVSSDNNNVHQKDVTVDIESTAFYLPKSDKVQYVNSMKNVRVMKRKTNQREKYSRGRGNIKGKLKVAKLHPLKLEDNILPKSRYNNTDLNSKHPEVLLSCHRVSSTVYEEEQCEKHTIDQLNDSNSKESHWTFSNTDPIHTTINKKLLKRNINPSTEMSSEVCFEINRKRICSSKDEITKLSRSSINMKNPHVILTKIDDVILSQYNEFKPQSNKLSNSKKCGMNARVTLEKLDDATLSKHSIHSSLRRTMCKSRGQTISSPKGKLM